MKPTWWFLDAIGLLLVGLLALVETFVPAGGLQTVLQIAVVIMGFGLMGRWARHNRVALELEECRRRRGTVGHRRLVSPPDSFKSVEQEGSRMASSLSPDITGSGRRRGANFEGAA
jgi:hypothetical protein